MRAESITTMKRLSWTLLGALVLVAGTSGVARGAPIEGATYDQTDPSAPVIVFTVRNGAITDDAWSWPITCTVYGDYDDPGDDEIRQGDELFEPSSWGIPPTPIDAGGHFRIQLDNVTEPSEENRYTRYEVHILIEGTIDGTHATGTAKSTTDWRTFPDHPDETCESGVAHWFADAVPEAGGGDGGDSGPPCEDAKAKVASLKAKLRATDNPEKRKKLKKKLARAKGQRDAACD